MSMFKQLTRKNLKTKLLGAKSMSSLSPSNTIHKHVIVEDPTNIKLIEKDYGLRKFLQKTYLWTGGGIISTLGLSEIIATNFLQYMSVDNLPVMFGSGLILSIGGCFGIYMTKYDINVEKIICEENKNKNEQSVNEILNSTNSTGRLISYASIITGISITTAPILQVYPDAVLPALMASSCVFGGATAYTLNKKQNSLGEYGSVLYGGLTGLIGISVMGLTSNYFFGNNMFSESIHFISLYGGIPLFTGLIAYDTHKAINRYKDRDPDHLGCSLELYLDFMNLLIRFIEIIGKNQRN